MKLDKSLTFRHHLVALHKKLSLRVTLLGDLRRWNAGAKILCTAAPSLAYSTAEYCHLSGVASERIMDGAQSTVGNTSRLRTFIPMTS